jgi:hypothetical protein
LIRAGGITKAFEALQATDATPCATIRFDIRMNHGIPAVELVERDALVYLERDVGVGRRRGGRGSRRARSCAPDIEQTGADLFDRGINPMREPLIIDGVQAH